MRGNTQTLFAHHLSQQKAKNTFKNLLTTHSNELLGTTPEMFNNEINKNSPNFLTIKNTLNTIDSNSIAENTQLLNTFHNINALMSIAPTNPKFEKIY